MDLQVLCLDLCDSADWLWRFNTDGLNYELIFI
jgi:hypothetical protein